MRYDNPNIINNKGENWVYHNLKELDHERETWFLRNLYLPFRSGDKEIDMVWFTPYGIYSIEIKGMAEGNVITTDSKYLSDKTKWTFEGIGGKKTNIINSPLVQSKHNEKLVRSRLFLDMPKEMRNLPLLVKNYVVFSNEVILPEDFKDFGIFTITDFVKHYTEEIAKEEPIYEWADLKSFYDALKKYSDMSVRKHYKHTDEVRRLRDEKYVKAKENYKLKKNGSHDHDYKTNKKKISKMEGKITEDYDLEL